MENKRKKLELQINSPVNLQLLYSEPIIGENTYGSFYCYAVKKEDDCEYSFFSPLKIHNELVNKGKGTKFQLTRTATQKGKKLVTDFDIEFLDNGKDEKKSEPKLGETEYYSAMLKSYKEAAKIQSKFSAVNLNQCAVTLYISRVKTNGFNNYPKE